MGYVVAPLVGSHIAQEIPTRAWTVAHLMFGVVLGLWPALGPVDFPGGISFSSRRVGVNIKQWA